MSYQKILIMNTKGVGLRSEAFGWSYENSKYVKPDKHIGLSLGAASAGEKGRESHGCPLKAMHAGWKLMAPPTEFEETWYKEDTDEAYPVKCAEWWFTMECE